MSAALIAPPHDLASAERGRAFLYGGLAVGAIHLILLAAWLWHTPKPPMRAVQTPALIEAQLIAPAAMPTAAPSAVPSATPSAAQHPTTPPAARPVAKPRAPALPIHTVSTPQALTPATPQTASTQTSTAATPSSPSTPSAPSGAAPAPAAPQAATLPAGAPLAVPHLTCTIARPDYPALSRHNGESGSVLVQLVIDVQGHIEDALLRSSSGHPRLDQAALQAARASQCQPYLEHGEAIRASANVPFRFTLDD